MGRSAEALRGSGRAGALITYRRISYLKVCGLGSLLSLTFQDP
jgi:hypothetical protein